MTTDGASLNMMPEAEMAGVVGQILKAHGAGVLEDRSRLNGLLRDHAPSQIRGIRLLLAAYDEGVPGRIAASGTALAPAKVEQEVAGLVANAGLQADLARWAVRVWNGAIAPAASLAPASPPMAPSAEGLTWGDEAVAPSAPPMGPAATTAAQPFWKSNNFRYGAAGIIAVIAVVRLLTGGPSSTPQTPPTEPQTQPQQQPRPQQQPASPPPQNQPATQPQQGNVPLVSKSNNYEEWPRYAAGTNPDGDPLKWQFGFFVQLGDGRIVNIFMRTDLQRDLKTGTGVVLARDTQYNDEEHISVARAVVSRDLDAGTSMFFTNVVALKYEKNPSQVPGFCLRYTSGRAQQSFQPQQGAFCVMEVQNNVCGPMLGCGRLQ